MLKMVHSCCPNKRDINAPSFRFQPQESFTLSNGIGLDTYECEACKTIVIVERVNA